MTSNPTSEAGMYTDAHAALDDLARERIAAAEAKVSQLEALVTSLRNQLEEAEKALQIIAWEGAESASSKQILAACRDTAREALAASTLYGLEKINVSSVSRAEVAASTGVKSDSSEGH